MRRQGPDGEEHPADAYVFGNEAGEQVKDVKRAWQRAVLLAHGHKPADATKVRGEKTVKTALLTPDCQQRLQVSICTFTISAGRPVRGGSMPTCRFIAFRSGSGTRTFPRRARI